MKPLAAATLGLLVGGLATNPGCLCACPEADPISDGAYVSRPGDGVEADYRFVVAGSKVTESFTRGADEWEIEYELD